MTDGGRLLAGRYRLLEQIDSGGTSNIYRAHDEMTDTIVAVKILKPELTDNEEFVTRFKKEVQASLKLRHANIIRAYDAGLDDGNYYIVMELIEGKTLKHLININGPLPIKYVVNITKKLALALEYAHAKGFIHRDIKPHNVLIDMSGEPYIADFGIARNVEQNTITMEEDNVMGSVHYFSPEQARGERADKRSDLYSLGIMLYEMLAGRVPFDGDTSVAIALRHLNEPMPDVTLAAPGVPESIKKIILKAAQKDKHFRYKSAFAMYEDLQRCLTEPDGEYVKYTESKRAAQRAEELHGRRSRKSANRVFITIGISVAVVAVVVAIIALVLSRNIVKEVATPSIVGMPISDALMKLYEEGLVGIREDVYASQPQGTVVEQNPEEGKEILEGSEVVIFVSMGALTEQMPNVTDMPIESAREALKLAGIEIREEKTVLEVEAAVGFVTEQYPLPGQPVPDEGVTLTYKASPDEGKLRVPGVVGEPLAGALALLTERGFSQYYVVEEESDMTPGTVTMQTPGEEEELFAGDPVRLTVSRIHTGAYVCETTIDLIVPADQTPVVMAVEDFVGGYRVYDVLLESVETAGAHSKAVSLAAYFDSVEEQLEKQLVLIIGGEMRSVNVVFEREGDALSGEE
ncbi:MAG TPA: Stk1 family PASTA domain-containing Ser/Thr kinase [Clostridiales bacterium]|nr:Stk1 family PASTA domain-containing Ser/Thr kinase [Clostridiales bacterium]